MGVSGANKAVWRTGGGRMRVSGANKAVWRTGGGWMRVSGANLVVWRTGAAQWGPREQIGRFGARERRGGDTVSKVSENRLGEQRNGAATEEAAGRPPKGFAAKEGV